MKSLIIGDKPTVARLAERLKQASSHSEYQRIQCVLIRATLGSSAAEIAQLLGWSTATVHVLHSRWAKEGDAIFDLRGRGGRHYQHLSADQERDLLAPFVERAQAGGMLTVAEIQQAYQEQVGKAVAPSTIYRLLDRHGWRKVVPGPGIPRRTLRHRPPLKKLRRQVRREAVCQAERDRRGAHTSTLSAPSARTTA
jgi:transposase